MEPFNWKCTYCDHAQVATYLTYRRSFFDILSERSCHGQLGVEIRTIVCSNQKCKEITLFFDIRPAEFRSSSLRPDYYPVGDPIHSWQLLPESTAKPQPEYIPASIADNYKQACRIKDLSPNASAAMSRRCLQGIIRDFWGVNGKRSLWAEIQAIKDRVAPTTWKAIDTVREVGNIGAHMKQDVDLLLDVEPDEAQALIGLIEMLFEDWYVDRHEREERSAAVIALGQKKKTQMDATKTATTM